MRLLLLIYLKNKLKYFLIFDYVIENESKNNFLIFFSSLLKK